MAGYSGTPLCKKLGLKQGCRLVNVGAPPGFDALLRAGQPPKDMSLTSRVSRSRAADVIVYFTRSAAQLQRRFATLAASMNPHGSLWVAWPKRTSGVHTDVTEDVVRDVALAAGLVDNKVCAIDETWSALRLVVRVKDRPGAR